MLGAGAGYGSPSLPDEWISDRGSGVATTLQFGVGLDDRTILHYAGRQIWVASDEGTLFHVFPMVAVTHYLHDAAPGLFLSGGGGVGAFDGVNNSSGDFEAGITLFGGAGYEFARHWNVEVDVANTFTPGHSVATVFASLGVLAY